MNFLGKHWLLQFRSLFPPLTSFVGILWVHLYITVVSEIRCYIILIMYADFKKSETKRRVITSVRPSCLQCCFYIRK